MDATSDIIIPLDKQYGFQKVCIHQNLVLGEGAYSKVTTATLDDEKPCAAEQLHEVLLNNDDPRCKEMLAMFRKELQVMQDLTHPHIVKFLTVAENPRTGHPILLMELLNENLTNFLKGSVPDGLPYHMQVNITHDIALAVAYLHSKRIIHCNLSSNNILLTADYQVKVSDFICSHNMDSDEMFPCPGSIDYMPPEALVVEPHYDEKLDIFSMGVLMIQTITCKFPDPTGRYVEKGGITVLVPEIECRRSDIDIIPPSHPLLSLALNCLKDKSHQRPSAAELCQRLTVLKKTAKEKEGKSPKLYLVQTLCMYTVHTCICACVCNCSVCQHISKPAYFEVTQSRFLKSYGLFL